MIFSVKQSLFLEKHQLFHKIIKPAENWISQQQKQETFGYYFPVQESQLHNDFA